MTREPYEQWLAVRLDRVYPGAYERLSHIQSLPEAAAEGILRELLETGCLSQNRANTEASRRAFSKLPPSWVAAHLPAVVPVCLFREREWQEWEFRRAAELLRERFPDAFEWLADYARGLRNPEVDEAVSDCLE